jgi:hypothetical protein
VIVAVCNIPITFPITDRTFRNWTKNKREQIEQERDSKVIDLWLQCYTYSDISNMINEPETTIKRIIEKVQNGKIAEMDFSPQLYNIWNFSKNNNEILSYLRYEARTTIKAYDSTFE